MPGVIDGQPYWEEKDSQIRGFGSHSHQRAMSPYHHGNEKIVSRSHHSNGYGSDHHSEPNDDGATYLLEHLATFSVGNQYGLVAPKDGLRRLLQMEKSSGIWTQKMQMRLERNWVIIIDYENGDVVERFPMSLISDPTAYTSDGRRELYNNILIFIVREDPKSKSHNPSEMHIFQCAQVSAQDVVDEIKMFMSGKSKSRYKDNMRQLPPPPSNPPPDPPVNGLSGISVREQVNMFNAAAAAASYSPHREANYPQQRTERSGKSDLYVRESYDETSSTTSEKYEQDVTILNHCFDDIERFIARLQHAAAAYKELERRQKNRKNKKKDMGDGMLSMRAKPPPEREFIDILQKFKLSFNLLAKLKSHIHDPNAPELVHFLFTPLALIIDAAKDSNYNSNLASKVITPLLTRESIELLTNCCTSKETDLWHSLGEPWIIPREQWKDFDKEYHPVFSDGWAPEYPSFDEREPPEIAGAAASVPPYHRNEVVAEERDYHHQMYSREEKSGRYDAGFFYNHEKHGNHNHGSSPSAIGDRHSHSIYETRQYEEHDETNRRDFPSEREARFPTAEREPRDRDVRSDFSADSIERTSNLDPHKQFEWQNQQWLEELKSQNAKIVQVVYPRTANNDKELTVIRGEYLEVLDDSRKWWKARNMRGQVAHVPHTIITPYNSNGIDSDVFNNPLYATKGSPRETSNESPVPKGNFDDVITSSPESPTRRPPSIPTPASADWVRRERQGKKDSIIDQVHIQKLSLAAQTDDNEDNLQSISPHDLFKNKNQHSSKQSMGVQTDDDDVKPILLEKIFKSDTNRQDNVEKEFKAVQTHTNKELIPPQESFQSKDEYHKLLKELENDWEDTFETWETPMTSKPMKNELDAKYTQTNIPLETIDAKEAQKQLQKEVEIVNRPFKLGSKLNKKWICPEHNKSSCSYLNLHSNSSQIKHWLEVKGFSEKSQVILESMNGDMLFSLKKEQLEKYLGEEGSRLYSHLIIQRNILGIKTIRSEELRNILEQRRQVTDQTAVNSSTITLELNEDANIDEELSMKLLQFLSKQSSKHH